MGATDVGDGGKVGATVSALTSTAGNFNDQAPILAGVIEQVTAGQHVDTGDGSLDGLISGLVGELASSLGGVGRTALQGNAAALMQTAKNFRTVASAAHGH